MSEVADVGSKDFGEKCRWFVETLLDRKGITKIELEAKFGNIDKYEWSRFKNAVIGVLSAVGVPVTHEADNFSVKGEWPKTFESEFFRPYDDYEHKDRIGWLVACYLRYVEDRNVFLGSGSTVFHVARNMIGLARSFPRLQQYRQLFWTINLAVAAELSVRGKNVLSRIAIPEGQLRTMTFRFSRVREPEWYCPIVVVSADGCLFNPQNSSASLYANESSVAANTNQFIEHAVDSVICCLSSRKLRFAEGHGQNAGPPIHNPTEDLLKKGVRFYLVTDAIPSDAGKDQKGASEANKKVAALKKAQWEVVTDLGAWYSAISAERKSELGKPFWLEDAKFLEVARDAKLPVRDEDVQPAVRAVKK